LIKAEICESQKTAKEGQEPIYPVQIPGGQSIGEGGIPVELQSPQGPTASAGGKFQQMHFNFVVPKGKVSNLMGVLNYLQSRYNRLEISINVGEGQLSEQEYEDKVKEAFRQMGIDLPD